MLDVNVLRKNKSADLATTIVNRDILSKISTSTYGDRAFLADARFILKIVREYISLHPNREYAATLKDGLLYINGDFVERIVPLPPKGISAYSERADYYENKILARGSL